MKIYTRSGDQGTTSLRLRQRLDKDDPLIEANGAIDEAQSALGMARAECRADEQLSSMIEGVERDLWALMGELASCEKVSPKSEPTHLAGDFAPGAGQASNKSMSSYRPLKPAVTEPMVEALESQIDLIMSFLELSPFFALPGENRLSALLDHARTIVRRAERRVVSLDLVDSCVPKYLNRLSDLCWAMARRVESEHLVVSRSRGDELRGLSPHRPTEESEDSFLAEEAKRQAKREQRS